MRRRHFLPTACWPLLACDSRTDVAGIEGGFIGASDQRGHVLREARSAIADGPVRRTRVLIAGGGVAGLAAARALRLRGQEDFAVLELENSPGGNSRAGVAGGLPCPLGAHYLPLPDDSAPEVQDLLTELGLAGRSGGQWRLNSAGERHLCHSPQERLYFRDEWQEGLLPQDGIGAATLLQYQVFERAVAAAQAESAFAIPVSKRPFRQYHQALNAIPFVAWLQRKGLDDPHLRWYLDYCCRDDYGAGLDTVSAWAGIHYFASRHGFRAPGSAVDTRDGGVLTWPEGNGWLTRQLAAGAGERCVVGRTVTRIEVLRKGVEVDVIVADSGRTERWLADHCIVALPLFVAAKVLRQPPAALQVATATLRYAPWLVANVHLREPLADRPGAPLSWDNVIYTGAASGSSAQQLGYVNAGHQSTNPMPGPMVLTHYRAFGIDPTQRQRLMETPWAAWRDSLLAELQRPHPDLAAKASRIDVMRYGHAMAVPTPGTASHPALQALRSSAKGQRLHFAHADLSGYSIFEEAFSHGHRAGMAV